MDALQGGHALAAPLSRSSEYESFRSSVALKKVAVDERHPDKVWQLFDCGPREVTVPLVCLPPVSGTADCFFLQCMALSAKGHRVIAVRGPVFYAKHAIVDSHVALVLLSRPSLPLTGLWTSGARGSGSSSLTLTSKRCVENKEPVR